MGPRRGWRQPATGAGGGAGSAMCKGTLADRTLSPAGPLGATTVNLPPPSPATLATSVSKFSARARQRRFFPGLPGSPRGLALLLLCAPESKIRILLPARPVGAAISSRNSRARRPGAGAPLAATLAEGPGAHMGAGAGSHLCRYPSAWDAPSGRGR